MRTLLTGGSGFIAAHILDDLLKNGHSVVTTVRSLEKANKIKEGHPEATKDQLDFTLVEDISRPDAFANAVVSDPPFEAVIHTASPFHFNATDVQRDYLDPAVNGTKGVLHAIKSKAPTVKKVVITSSFAAMINPTKGNWPEHTYSEKDWSPLTHEKALENNSNGYRASKLFAERAGWEFIENEKPNFTLTVMNPPLVLGPIVHYLNALSALNTSNQRVRDIVTGQWKDVKEIPPTGVHAWVDVRDLSLAHVKAITSPAASNKRFFVVAGMMSNREIMEIVRKNFPEYQSKLPPESVPGGGMPEGGIFKCDNSLTKEALGLNYRSLDESVIDLVKSLKNVGA